MRTLVRNASQQSCAQNSNWITFLSISLFLYIAGEWIVRHKASKVLAGSLKWIVWWAKSSWAWELEAKNTKEEGKKARLGMTRWSRGSESNGNAFCDTPVMQWSAVGTILALCFPSSLALGLVVSFWISRGFLSLSIALGLQIISSLMLRTPLRTVSPRVDQILGVVPESESWVWHPLDRILGLSDTMCGKRSLGSTGYYRKYRVKRRIICLLIPKCWDICSVINLNFAISDFFSFSSLQAHNYFVSIESFTSGLRDDGSTYYCTLCEIYLRRQAPNIRWSSVFLPFRLLIHFHIFRLRVPVKHIMK